MFLAFPATPFKLKCHPLEINTISAVWHIFFPKIKMMDYLFLNYG